VIAISLLLLASLARADETSHVVTVETPTLELVSVYLYGRVGMWPIIARWNDLQPPYALKHGQKLVLRRPP
jgi:hypothetical protein